MYVDVRDSTSTGMIDQGLHMYVDVRDSTSTGMIDQGRVVVAISILDYFKPSSRT